MKRIEKLSRILANPRWRRAWIQHRVAAGVEHVTPLSGLDCSTIIDIGANRGQFSLVATHCFPAAGIHAFEPLPEVCELFQKVHGTSGNIHLHAAAVGEQEGKATIHISKRDDSSSLLPITALQNQLFPGTSEIGTQTITTGPLTSFISAESIPSPALLKLDVQGFELEALKGCDALLECFQHVYVECSFVPLYEGQALAGKVIAWLQERKFLLQGVYNMNYDKQGKAIQADFLFSQEKP